MMAVLDLSIAMSSDGPISFPLPSFSSIVNEGVDFPSFESRVEIAGKFITGILTSEAEKRFVSECQSIGGRGG